MLVLKTDLDDIREKFSLLEDLDQRLDVFCSSINGLIAFKAIGTSADEGIVVRVNDGEKQALPLSVLSSGEQHLIVLIGKLVFNTNRGSLVPVSYTHLDVYKRQGGAGARTDRERIALDPGESRPGVANLGPENLYRVGGAVAGVE